MKTKVLLIVLGTLAFAGCSGGGGDGGGNNPPPSARTLTGIITYDKVPPSANGLDYAATTQEPVRGVVVELLDATNAVVATGQTDANGQYSFSWAASGPASVKVRVKAQTLSPDIRVENNAQGDALWVADTAPVNNDSIGTFNINIPSGWTGTSYGAPRSAAPFAVLDAAYSCARAFLGERPVTFPALKINWSPDNRPEPGDKALGQIGTSHWDLQELYILGKEDADTDEFDSHIIAHEWGHYFESKLSRSDSPGGTHGNGDIKDPRLAWGEGWATAFGAIVFHPDTVYADTAGPQQAQTGVFTDIEDNAADDPNPGWFSEGSVLHVFYDLWDPASPNEPFDQVSLPLGALHDVMVGSQKNTEAFTTLFSFAAGLEEANPSAAVAIDNLLAHRGVAAPIQDPLGTGETNDGGIAGALPVYNILEVNGAAVPLTFTSVPEEVVLNSLGTVRYGAFLGNGAQVTVAAAVQGDREVGIFLYQGGNQLQFNGGTGTAEVSQISNSDAVYTVLIVSSDPTPDTVYTGAVAVSSP